MSRSARSPVTLTEDANVSLEAAERWRQRHEGARVHLDSSLQATGVAAQHLETNATDALHLAWKSFTRGLAAGTSCAGVAYFALLRHGYYRKKGVTSRTDRVSVVFASFAVPFLLVMKFENIQSAGSRSDTLHAR